MKEANIMGIILIYYFTLSEMCFTRTATSHWMQQLFGNNAAKMLQGCSIPARTYYPRAEDIDIDINIDKDKEKKEKVRVEEIKKSKPMLSPSQTLCFTLRKHSFHTSKA